MSTYKGLPTNIGPLPKTFEQLLVPRLQSIPDSWLHKNALVGTHMHTLTGKYYLKNEKGEWIPENLDPDNKSKKKRIPDIFPIIAKIPTTKYPCSGLVRPLPPTPESTQVSIGKPKSEIPFATPRGDYMERVREIEHDIGYLPGKSKVIQEFDRTYSHSTYYTTEYIEYIDVVDDYDDDYE